MRAREAGIRVGVGVPGDLNAITDVAGVAVGHATIVRGDGPLRIGEGPVRTGVTIIQPRPAPAWQRPVFAGFHCLNGNGEVTGLAWLRESGLLTSPIGLTNTHSVGLVRDQLAALESDQRPADEPFWSLPVVGETWDGLLNDTRGQHVTAADVEAAVRSAHNGPVAEGNVGGGTGMVSHGFKGGIGTSSRQVRTGNAAYTIGVLVQANHGKREHFTVNGVPVGQLISDVSYPVPRPWGGGLEHRYAGAGSIIIVIATDAPLLPHQLNRLAARSFLGIGLLGASGEHFSGDFAIAFSTANEPEPAHLIADPPQTTAVSVLNDTYISALYSAVIEATEESVLNALAGAQTLVGRDGVTAHALPVDEVVRLLQNDA